MLGYIIFFKLGIKSWLNMKNPKNFEKIVEAREILGIEEKISVKELKQLYREQLKKWHPDKCKENHEQCKEKIIQINKAYDRLNKYMTEYKFDLSDNEIKNNLGQTDWWFQKFGDDPIWG
jgi:DnaJ-class molecular chaperone